MKLVKLRIVCPGEGSKVCYGLGFTDLKSNIIIMSERQNQ